MAEMADPDTSPDGRVESTPEPEPSVETAADSGGSDDEVAKWRAKYQRADKALREAQARIHAQGEAIAKAKADAEAKIKQAREEAEATVGELRTQLSRSAVESAVLDQISPDHRKLARKLVTAEAASGFDFSSDDAIEKMQATLRETLPGAAYVQQPAKKAGGESPSIAGRHFSQLTPDEQKALLDEVQRTGNSALLKSAFGVRGGGARRFGM